MEITFPQLNSHDIKSKEDLRPYQAMIESTYPHQTRKTIDVKPKEATLIDMLQIQYLKTICKLESNIQFQVISDNFKDFGHTLHDIWNSSENFSYHFCTKQLLNFLAFSIIAARDLGKNETMKTLQHYTLILAKYHQNSLKTLTSQKQLKTHRKKDASRKPGAFD